MNLCLPEAWENFPQGLVLFVKNGGKSQREKSQESKCNVTIMTQSSIEFTKDWRLRENIENKIREEYPVKLFLPAEG